VRTRSSRISESRSGSIVSPTIFARSISKSAFGGSTPYTIGTFAALWPR
jgi:hypothetical protein